MADLTITRVSGEEALQLTVSGPLTIAEAARFKEALAEALAQSNEVTLDLTGVTAMDLTALQLLCAAHGTALSTGKGVRVEPGGNEAFRKVVDDAGFQTHVGCQHDSRICIWTGGNC